MKIQTSTFSRSEPDKMAEWLRSVGRGKWKPEAINAMSFVVAMTPSGHVRGYAFRSVEWREGVNPHTVEVCILLEGGRS